MIFPQTSWMFCKCWSPAGSIQVYFKSPIILATRKFSHFTTNTKVSAPKPQCGEVMQNIQVFLLFLRRKWLKSDSPLNSSFLFSLRNPRCRNYNLFSSHISWSFRKRDVDRYVCDSWDMNMMTWQARRLPELTQSAALTSWLLHGGKGVLLTSRQTTHNTSQDSTWVHYYSNLYWRDSTFPQRKKLTAKRYCMMGN